MATDVRSMIFTDQQSLVEFMSHLNLQSSDIVAICPMNHGLALFYTEATDKAPPAYDFSYPASATEGEIIKMYLRLFPYSQLNISSMVAKVRNGVSAWEDLPAEQVAPDLWVFTIQSPYVKNPGVDFYITLKDFVGNQSDIGTVVAPKTITVP